MTKEQKEELGQLTKETKELQEESRQIIQETKKLFCL